MRGWYGLRFPADRARVRVRHTAVSRAARQSVPDATVPRPGAVRARSAGRRRPHRRSAGRMICMGSVHRIVPWARQVNYASSRGGVGMPMQTSPGSRPPSDQGRRGRAGCHPHTGRPRRRVHARGGGRSAAPHPEPPCGRPGRHRRRRRRHGVRPARPRRRHHPPSRRRNDALPRLRHGWRRITGAGRGLRAGGHRCDRPSATGLERFLIGRLRGRRFVQSDPRKTCWSGASCSSPARRAGRTSGRGGSCGAAGRDGSRVASRARTRSGMVVSPAFMRGSAGPPRRGRGGIPPGIRTPAGDRCVPPSRG